MSNQAREVLQRQRHMADALPAAAAAFSSPTGSSAAHSGATAPSAILSVEPKLPGFFSPSARGASSAAAASASSSASSAGRSGGKSGLKRKGSGGRSLLSHFAACESSSPGGASASSAAPARACTDAMQLDGDHGENKIKPEEACAAAAAASSSRWQDLKIDVGSLKAKSAGSLSSRQSAMSATCSKMFERESEFAVLSEEQKAFADEHNSSLEDYDKDYTAVLLAVKTGTDEELALLVGAANQFQDDTFMRWARNSASDQRKTEMSHFLFQCFTVVHSWLVHLQPSIPAAAAAAAATADDASVGTGNGTAVPLTSLMRAISPWQLQLDRSDIRSVVRSGACAFFEGCMQVPHKKAKWRAKVAVLLYRALGWPQSKEIRDVILKMNMTKLYNASTGEGRINTWHEAPIDAMLLGTVAAEFQEAADFTCNAIQAKKRKLSHQSPDLSKRSGNQSPALPSGSVAADEHNDEPADPPPVHVSAMNDDSSEPASNDLASRLQKLEDDNAALQGDATIKAMQISLLEQEKALQACQLETNVKEVQRLRAQIVPLSTPILPPFANSGLWLSNVKPFPKERQGGLSLTGTANIGHGYQYDDVVLQRSGARGLALSTGDRHLEQCVFKQSYLSESPTDAQHTLTELGVHDHIRLRMAPCVYLPKLYGSALMAGKKCACSNDPGATGAERRHAVLEITQTMEWIRGPSLADVFSRFDEADPSHDLSNPTMAQRLQICCQLVRAVHALHDADVMHGDIHPGNVIITSKEIFRRQSVAADRKEPAQDKIARALHLDGFNRSSTDNVVPPPGEEFRTVLIDFNTSTVLTQTQLCLDRELIQGVQKGCAMYGGKHYWANVKLSAGQQATLEQGHHTPTTFSPREEYVRIDHVSLALTLLDILRGVGMFVAHNDKDHTALRDDFRNHFETYCAASDWSKNVPSISEYLLTAVPVSMLIWQTGDAEKRKLHRNEDHKFQSAKHRFKGWQVHYPQLQTHLELMTRVPLTEIQTAAFDTPSHPCRPPSLGDLEAILEAAVKNCSLEEIARVNNIIIDDVGGITVDTTLKALQAATLLNRGSKDDTDHAALTEDGTHLVRKALIAWTKLNKRKYPKQYCKMRDMHAFTSQQLDQMNEGWNPAMAELMLQAFCFNYSIEVESLESASNNTSVFYGIREESGPAFDAQIAWPRIQLVRYGHHWICCKPQGDNHSMSAANAQ